MQVRDDAPPPRARAGSPLTSSEAVHVAPSRLLGDGQDALYPLPPYAAASPAGAPPLLPLAAGNCVAKQRCTPPPRHRLQSHGGGRVGLLVAASIPRTQEAAAAGTWHRDAPVLGLPSPICPLTHSHPCSDIGQRPSPRTRTRTTPFERPSAPREAAHKPAAVGRCPCATVAPYTPLAGTSCGGRRVATSQTRTCGCMRWNATSHWRGNCWNG